jgi:glycerol-3-phosphate dehydrogenase
VSEAPFSAATRFRDWEALGEREFDLVVVGAGITGSGVALDAAGRGLSVLLVDAGDIGRGTSSRSSRLIHGGLRYLETLDFRLVFEALAERRRLLRLAPHLVHPLSFLFPVFRRGGLSRLKLGAGMWLYDVLTLFRGVARHRMLGAGAAREREPRLRAEGLLGGAVYFDAQVDDARLTLAVARAAHDGGAVVISHARVEAFVREADGRVSGVRLRDALGGGEREVRARLVVAAAGPWLDELRRLADPQAAPRLRLTKGAHVVVPRERVGNHGALIFRSALDGRVMFVLPWGDGLTYVGTTDTDFEGSLEEPPVDADDVDYLLGSANALFPEARLSRDDVVGVWCGVRPLLRPLSERSAGATSREHDLWRDRSGLLCVAGGKLTTYRSMAAEVAERAAELLRHEHGVESGDFYTEHVDLPGTPTEGWEPLLERCRAAATGLGVDEASARHLAHAYGSAALEVLERVRERPELAARVAPSRPPILAEIDHTVENEMACTLDDLLRRRLHLTESLPDGGLGVAPEVARRMAANPALDWNDETSRRQLQDYRRLVPQLLDFRGSAAEGNQ